jgi:DNA-binding PadR family transcriptional regulator
MAAKRRKVANPLALALLACLRQAPMHPYEMAATLRTQGKERSIKLNYGSLYTVVDNLAKHGLIEPVQASREGRRPERTVYRLTGAGQDELEDWLAELLGTPVKEYPQFEAALAEMAVLSPDRVLELLRNRVGALEAALAAERAELAGVPWLPRLFLIENEYHLAMQEAELAWVRGIVAEFEAGSFPGLADWAHWVETGELPEEVANLPGSAMPPAAAGGGPAGPGPGAERSR